MADGDIVFPSVKAHCVDYGARLGASNAEDLVGIEIESTADSVKLTISAQTPPASVIDIDSSGSISNADYPGYHRPFDADELRQLAKTVHRCSAALAAPSAQPALRDIAKQLELIADRRPKAPSTKQ